MATGPLADSVDLMLDAETYDVQTVDPPPISWYQQCAPADDGREYSVKEPIAEK